MPLLQWHCRPARARPSLRHVDIHLHPRVHNSASTWKRLSMLPHVQRGENLVGGQEVRPGVLMSLSTIVFADRLVRL
eukprot:2273052-Alexandrium_andersonii.AAC.1